MPEHETDPRTPALTTGNGGRLGKNQREPSVLLMMRRRRDSSSCFASPNSSRCAELEKGRGKDELYKGVVVFDKFEAIVLMRRWLFLRATTEDARAAAVLKLSCCNGESHSRSTDEVSTSCKKVAVGTSQKAVVYEYNKELTSSMKERKAAIPSSPARDQTCSGPQRDSNLIKLACVTNDGSPYSADYRK